MELPTRKLVHTFGALADLGQEITDSSNFDEMALTSLHLLLGALGIRRGAIAEHEAPAGLLRFVAVRGLEESFPATLVLSQPARAALLSPGMTAIDLEGSDHSSQEDEVLLELLAPCRSPSGSVVVKVFWSML